MDDDVVFFGFGQMHDLRDGEGDGPSRLYGMRSVKQHDLRIKPRTVKGQQPPGFHIPRISP